MMNASLQRIGMASVCLAGLLSIGLQPPALAATAQVRTAEQAVNAAQAKLGTAQQGLAKAQRDFTQGQSAQQAATNRVQQARQAAAQTHGAELGMTAAITERDAAFHQIQARRKAIEAALKSSVDYQAAERETETARRRLSELPDEKSLTEEQQEKLKAELSARIRLPTEMRKTAEAKDAEMQQATQHYQAAGKKIVALQPRLKRMIDSDPGVTEAAAGEKQAATALEEAQKKLTRAEQDYTIAQSNLDSQNQRLQSAIAQSRHHRRY